MSEAPAIRRIDHQQAADREPVLALLAEYLAAAGEPDDPAARYDWLYRRNPHGSAITLLAMDSDDRPVGMTSLFPRTVLVGGRQRRGAIGGDAYVLPERRGRGIASTLHRAALAEMGDGSVEFMFGPPEPNNLRALCKAGAVVTGTVRRYVRPGWLSAARVLALLPPRLRRFAEAGLRRLPAGRTISAVALGARPDPRAEDAWQSVRDSEGRPDRVLPERTADYCAWRYGASPSRRQQAYVLSDPRGVPIGLTAIERADGRAAIVDFVAARGYARDAMRAVIDLCAPAHDIEFHLHAPCHRSELSLMSLGFVPRADKPFQVQTALEGADRQLLLDAAAWHYTRGDGDVDHVLS